VERMGRYGDRASRSALACWYLGHHPKSQAAQVPHRPPAPAVVTSGTVTALPTCGQTRHAASSLHRPFLSDTAIPLLRRLPHRPAFLLLRLRRRVRFLSSFVPPFIAFVTVSSSSPPPEAPGSCRLARQKICPPPRRLLLLRRARCPVSCCFRLV